MSHESATTLGARLFVTLQYLLPQHLLSRMAYALTRCRTEWLKNALIRSFVRAFRPDMSDAAEPDPLRYPSFNAFFTRELRAGARPIAPETNAVISPVDGMVSQIGRITSFGLVQAKGHHYTLESLLAGAGEWCQRFSGGSFATLYLAPYNYHRIHMPSAGELSAAWYVPGKLFSVNSTTAAAVPGLFARNERVICTFEDGTLAFAIVLVGALFVGSISTVWHGEITPRRPRRLHALPVDQGSFLERGAEMGRFNMGSTVILLYPRGTVDWLPEYRTGSEVRVGRQLGRLL